MNKKLHQWACSDHWGRVKRWGKRHASKMLRRKLNRMTADKARTEIVDALIRRYG